MNPPRRQTRRAADGAGHAPSPPPPLGDAARDAVLRLLAAQARRFPDLELTEPETAGLDPRDAALAHAIYDTVVRRWLTLRHLLDARLSKPLAELEPRMQGVLLGCAAQLLFFDRVPAHAAINQAVEWAKRRIRPGAGGLANAVLRKVAQLRPESDASARRERYTGRRDELPLEDGTALVLTDDALPDVELERLAAATSHPPALLRAWAAAHPWREVQRLALHSLARPPVILNTAHARGPLPGAPLLAPHAVPGHHVFRGTRDELVALLGERRDLWVQDPASSAAVAAVADLRPRVVLDLCAGQGTKTRQLAALFPAALIVATDADAARVSTLTEVFRGDDRVRIAPLAEVRESSVRTADLIVLDVPCSNTGVLARRPEARYRYGAKTLASVADLQRQIIADAIPLLTETPRRGSILYSTCSLEPQENREQAQWAARWHGFRPEREQRHLPGGGPGEPDERYADGSFSVLLA